MRVTPTPDKRSIWLTFLLYPSHTLPTAAAPVMVGVALAVQQGVFSPWVVLLAFLGSWLIHLGGVLADNHELLRRHADVPEHPELLEAVCSGVLPLRELRRVMAACFVLGVAPGLWLYTIGGPPVAVLGVIGVLSSLGYAALPFRYARFGLAEPVFFLMFGVVAVVGTYYIQLASVSGDHYSWQQLWQQIPWPVWVVGLPCGALVTNVLIIDDIRDRHFDRAKGWRTVAVRFGLAGSRTEFVLLAIFAYALPVVWWLGGHYSPWILLPLLTLPEASIISRRVLTENTTAALLRMTPRASRLALLFSLLLSAGLLLQ